MCSHVRHVDLGFGRLQGGATVREGGTSNLEEERLKLPTLMLCCWPESIVSCATSTLFQDWADTLLKRKVLVCNDF